MKFLTRTTALVASAALLSTATARADDPDLGPFASASKFFATSNTVTVKFLYSLAAANNQLFFFTAVGSSGTFLIDVPGSAPTPGTGTPASAVITLSDFGLGIGDELIFGICTTNTSGDPNGCANPWTAFYMGPAARNSDGQIHAAILPAATWNGFGFGETADAGTLVIGFENRTASDTPPSDWDFNDVVFSVEGVTVPEPATMALLATGLVGLTGATLLRRRRNNS